ncbi:MAG: enoyl-CoA hydratase/isomerase family protein [Burkholderiaceae bacterium]|nr:enoyl-CoA hydratase/isomerase family protein [Burkholderiaceae bacterium]
MAYQTLEIEIRDGAGFLWLNRPELRNAMNDVMIGELVAAIAELDAEPAARVIVLGGRGKAFCAGADLNWMRAARDFTPAQARADSARLAAVLRGLYESAKPTLARVQGAAFAGGMGLVAACDLVIASTEAKFCLSEVRLGLIPAMISPYLLRAIGERQARRYMLSAEVFDAAQARDIGLIHEMVAADTLDATVAAMVVTLAAGAPGALGETKRLIREVVGRKIDDELVADTAARIAAARSSAEGQEGMASFFERRRPTWSPEPPK